MLARLEAALVTVAELTRNDPVYAPIFCRLEEEIALERAARDVIARARAIAEQNERRRQNEIGASRSRTCDRRPPSP